MFDPKSRYAKVPLYEVVDRRGRKAIVAGAAPGMSQALLGYHVLRQGERLDLLAARYLSDPCAFWRICELNGSVLPDALAEAREIAIPGGRL